MEYITQSSSTTSKRTLIAHWFVVAALTISFAVHGLSGIGNQVLVDESFWTYGRVEKFWDNVLERDWYNARTGDNKPGVTVAIAAGAGLFSYDNTKELKKADLNPNERRDVLTAFRVPLFITIICLLPLFYVTLRKLLDPWSALIAYSFITLSPLLLGMSRIVNPDALFWILAPLTLLFALLFGASIRWRMAIIAGIFLGLALLTKYTATILIIFIPILIMLRAMWLPNLSTVSTQSLHQQLRKLFTGYSIMLLFALITIVILYPATWVKPDRILLVTLWSPAMLSIWKPFVIALALFCYDIFLARTSRIAQTLIKLALYRDTLLSAFLILTITTITFVITDAWWWHLVDYQTIITSPKSILEKLGIWGIPMGISSNFYTLLFGLPMIAIAGIIAFCAQTIHQINTNRNLRKSLSITSAVGVILLLFIWFYYVGITASGVIGTVRYQIITYSLALIVASIGIVQFIGIIFRYVKSIKKYSTTSYSLNWLVLVGVITTGLMTLSQMRPYYFSYANAILPPGHVLNLKDMGDGSYQMALYLNKLPDATKISVWSDKNGVCLFFVGECTINSKVLRDITKRASIDFFVVSTGRTARSITINHGNLFVKMLYTDTPTVYNIYPGNNPANSIRLIRHADILHKTKNHLTQ